MRALLLPVLLMAFGLGFLALSIHAQAKSDAKSNAARTNTAKTNTPANAPKEDPKEQPKEEWLDDEGMKKLMETCKDNWNKLKINTKSKLGDKAAEAADALAADADKMLKFHKKEVREAKDYKDWVAELKKAAQDFSKAAKKSDWKEAEKHKEKIATACNDDGCHGKYRPEEDK